MPPQNWLLQQIRNQGIDLRRTPPFIPVRTPSLADRIVEQLGRPNAPFEIPVQLGDQARPGILSEGRPVAPYEANSRSSSPFLPNMGDYISQERRTTPPQYSVGGSTVTSLSPNPTTVSELQPRGIGGSRADELQRQYEA